MKKFLLYASAVAAMLSAGSCQKEVFNPVSEGETAVKLSIALPDGLQTKAMSKAESTDIVYYEIWNSDWTRQLYPVEQAGVQSAYASTKVENCTATLDLKLISDQTYNFIFWAQNEDCGAYDVTELKNVGVDYDVIAANGNQDKFDAFYAVETIAVSGPINQTVTLYRPFAQLNFGADEMTTTFGDIVVTATEIKVSELATVFNTVEGVGEKATSVAVPFTATGLATTAEALVAGGKSYTWVAMDYMLMMNTEALVNVEASFGVDGMYLPVTHSITNVPLKKNYRTNIVGDLFTTDAKLNIIVDPDFNQPDEIISMWDGTSVEEPEFDAATDTYEIGTAAELAWFAAAVNGKLPDTKAVPAPNTFAGKTVKVVADIDLQSAPWTPIGYWETFEGTFDGGDHTIRNLNVTATEADCYLGLFGCTDNATIKNVKIHNAVVKAAVGDNTWAGGHLGALVGYPDGTTVIENVALTGDIKVEGPMDKKGAQRIGAVVGGFEAKSLTLNNVTVAAAKGSYVKGNLYVGGVVGQPICPVAMTNVVSNIDVYSQDGMVGGIAGYVMPNSTLTDCSSTGNVYRVSAEGTENQLKRIGGILGSWESSYGKVVLDDCAFAGTLYIAGVEYTDYLYCGLVGRAANTDAEANGVLVINGLTFVDEHLAVDPEGNVVVYSLEGLQATLDAATSDVYVALGADIVGDATVSQKEGVNVVIDGMGKKYDGTIYVNGNSRYNGAETLTIKNVNFESVTVDDFISSNSSDNGVIRYAHNITVEGCSFVGGSANGVAIRTRQAFNIVVKDCTASLSHSFAQLTSTAGFYAEGVTVDAPRGFNLGNSNTEATFVDCDITATKGDGYGIRFDNGAALNVTGCAVSAYEPVVFRNNTAACQFNLSASTLTAAGGYEVVVESGAAPVMTGVDGLNVKNN